MSELTNGTAREIAERIFDELQAIPKDPCGDSHRSRRTRLKKKRLAELPRDQLFGVDTRRQELIRAQASRRGYRGKVNAKCVECIYDPFSGIGTWRQQVAACTSRTYPLWPIRAASEGRKAILTTEKTTISQ